MRKCSRCQTWKPLLEFKKDKSNSAGRGYFCNPCARELARQFYHSRPSSKKKEYLTAKQRAVVRNQIWLCRYLLEHPCVDCSEKDIEQLDFDHLPQSKKVHDICSMIRSARSIQNIELEIAKCEVVCCHCHRKRTNRRGNNYRLRFKRGELTLD